MVRILLVAKKANLVKVAMPRTVNAAINQKMIVVNNALNVVLVKTSVAKMAIHVVTNVLNAAKNARNAMPRTVNAAIKNNL